MGFAGIASHVIWAVVTLSVLGLGAVAGFEHAERMDDARDAAEALRAAKLDARFAAASFCFKSSLLETRFTATNQGRSPIDLEHTYVLVDGVARTATWDGTGDLWLPGEGRTFTASSSSEPARAALVTPNGIMTYGTKTICLTYAHVDAMALYNAGAQTTTFRKRDTVETRVTVRDADGVLAQGATVTLEIRRPDATLEFTGSAVTSATGVASISYTLPASVPTGPSWVSRVTGIAGTGYAYDATANVVTQVAFTVTT